MPVVRYRECRHAVGSVCRDSLRNRPGVADHFPPCEIELLRHQGGITHEQKVVRWRENRFQVRSQYPLRRCGVERSEKDRGVIRIRALREIQEMFSVWQERWSKVSAL